MGLGVGKRKGLSDGSSWGLVVAGERLDGGDGLALWTSTCQTIPQPHGTSSRCAAWFLVSFALAQVVSHDIGRVDCRMLYVHHRNPCETPMLQIACEVCNVQSGLRVYKL